MATPIRAQDREHFEIVQQALAVDGLHVAISSADRDRLADYAGTLARALASRYGLQVEAYQPGRLEALVADLMLHRYDGALSRISGANQQGRLQGASEATACVLFIPDAQSVRLQEFAQLARVASGLRQLRLVAMFGGAIPFERDARLQVMGVQLARWDLDADDTHDAPPAWAAQAAAPRVQAVRAPEPAIEPAIAATRAPAAARRARPWLAASATAAAAATATAAVMLAMIPGADGSGTPGSPALPSPAPTLTHSGTVQLAGEPPAGFRRAAVPGEAADSANQAASDAPDAPDVSGDMTDTSGAARTASRGEAR